ncbi:3'5'-cyclic nucleotide phosphodiesterase domain-containing protein [Phthorimaea operculella]|nr:3'5'-cyclic nucleotide phosphodiesterase domain-containing protein [Phthorimaea operculella]
MMDRSVETLGGAAQGGQAGGRRVLRPGGPGEAAAQPAAHRHDGQHKVAKLVADEFFDQGDLEKLQLNQQPIAMMDRSVETLGGAAQGGQGGGRRVLRPGRPGEAAAQPAAHRHDGQGDLEKLQLNQQPIAMMDREKKDELPHMQVGFIDTICLPLYRVLADTFPWIEPLYTGTYDNRQRWKDLAEKVEMGLTWIDHDTIDKPIEEFTASSEPIKDVEFTVTTLNCTKTTDSTVVAPVKTRFHSLRRTRPSGKPPTKPDRSKLTRSLYLASSRDAERERPVATTTSPVTSLPTEQAAQAERAPANKEQRVATNKTTKLKHKGRLCHML